MIAELSQVSTGYRILLLIHIITVIVGMGGVTLNALYAAEIRKRPGPGGRAIGEANFAVSEVAEKFIYTIPVTGILMVVLGAGWSFGQTWVWLSLVVYVIGIGVSHSVMIPGARRMNALMLEMEQGPPPAGGPPPQVAEIQSIGQRMAKAGPVLHLSLVVLIVLMIWKPGA
ncbi:MAG: DUF2269 family protein [Actinomycetota bacterium]